MPYVPAAAILSCLWLMLNLPVDTWIRFGAWMVVGLFVYFGYSQRHTLQAMRGSGGVDVGAGAGADVVTEPVGE